MNALAEDRSIFFYILSLYKMGLEQLLAGQLRADTCSLGHLLARTLARKDRCWLGHVLVITLARKWNNCLVVVIEVCLDDAIVR